MPVRGCSQSFVLIALPFSFWYWFCFELQLLLLSELYNTDTPLPLDYTLARFWWILSEKILNSPNLSQVGIWFANYMCWLQTRRAFWWCLKGVLEAIDHKLFFCPESDNAGLPMSRFKICYDYTLTKSAGFAQRCWFGACWCLVLILPAPWAEPCAASVSGVRCPCTPSMHRLL